MTATRKKPTAHQQRMAQLGERVYQTLRQFQQGAFVSPSSGSVVAGQLTVPLTAVMDAIVASADQIFPHRSGGKQR